MPTHGVLTDAAFHPGLPEFIASRVDGHSSLKVINTAQNQVNALTFDPPKLDAFHEFFKMTHGSDVASKAFEYDVRIDLSQCLCGSICLCHPCMLWPKEQAVHIRHLNTIIIVHDDFACTGKGQSQAMLHIRGKKKHLSHRYHNA
jgi:hypothetical protein